MAYEFVTLERPTDGVPAGSYIKCGRCGVLCGRQPNVSDWAAYDAPGIRGVDHGQRDGTGGTNLIDDHVALCKPCYLLAFKRAYPAAEPPKLFDGRVLASKVAPTGKKGKLIHG